MKSVAGGTLWLRGAACLILGLLSGVGDPRALGGQNPAMNPAIVEAGIPAARVQAGAVILSYTAAKTRTVSGFYVRLANCIGPAKEPVVVALRARGQLLPERAAVPVFRYPLKDYTKTGGLAQPPLDVGQEYRVNLGMPVTLKAGESVTVEVVSSESLVSGVTAGLQFQGIWPLVEMRQPFRAVRNAGPVSSVNWSGREVVVTGNQVKFDPECAPQNNSGIVADADGTLYQFTSFYSVDEQYGGGRGNSYARLFGFKQRPGANEWEKLGLLIDPTRSDLTYAGDPFAFRDHDGTPCLAYTTADGTKGFSDWKLIDGRLLRSKTESFSGPWSDPHLLYEKFPRGDSDDGRMIGIRIYPRPASKDYVLLWQHGGRDMTVRGVILPDLDATLTHEQIRQATVLVRNQEEGGGGFVHGHKGYLSTWQIPWVNDPTGMQRLYEFDLSDPLNPEKWQVMPGSWGFNDGTKAIEDGGCTADAWSLSMVGEELWATSVAWSVTHRKNSILACHVPWAKRKGEGFRYGLPRLDAYKEIVPVVEYALGIQCSLSLDFTGQGQEAYAFLSLGPSSQAGLQGAFTVEVSDQGSRLIWHDEEKKPVALTDYGGPKWRSGTTIKLKLQRNDDRLTAWVDGLKLGPVTMTDPAQKKLLAEPQRFKLYGWLGGLYSIKKAVLVDGPEK